MFDVTSVRQDFPLFKRIDQGAAPFAYLDSAATAQTPYPVIGAMQSFYEEKKANVHRGLYALSEAATAAYESSRAVVANYLHAQPESIVFTKGTTEAINLVAHGVGLSLKPGDEIIVSAMEHHANIVPWQLMCERTGASLKVIPFDEHGVLSQATYLSLLNKNTRFVSLVHTSNFLGTTNPIASMVRLAHERNVPVLVDGAQSIVHAPIDVEALDCDYFVFSGHKLYGPTGIGVLYGKKERLEQLPPYQGGGDMIEHVSFDKTTFAPPPSKFEAGTPPIAQAIGLGAAIDYLQSLDQVAIHSHEMALLRWLEDEMAVIPGLRFLGKADEKGPILSFVLDGVHAHDLAVLLDQQQVAVRAGHHCTMPAHHALGVEASLRVSMGLYTTESELLLFLEAFKQSIRLLK